MYTGVMISVGISGFCSRLRKYTMSFVS